MKLVNKPHSTVKELIGLNEKNEIQMATAEFSFGFAGLQSLMRYANCDSVIIVDSDGKHIKVK